MRNTGKKNDLVARGEEHAPDSPVYVLKTMDNKFSGSWCKTHSYIIGTGIKIHRMNVRKTQDVKNIFNQYGTVPVGVDYGSCIPKKIDPLGPALVLPSSLSN